jgi:RNA polymerase sigma-70 factor (ECF subfamily)
VEASAADVVAVFESHRSALVALAYRMLGDLGRAEDVVQEAWLRWDGHSDGVANPRAFLVTVVTRLCLNELDSARARREESRSDRLPEPVDLTRGGLAGLEAVDRISMAFLVALQRLTPAERAVLLLREVFDFEYGEISKLVNRSEAACRQLLKRAKENVSAEKRALESSPEEHRRLLRAFVGAIRAGDVAGVTKLLADDAAVVADGGPQGARFGRVRNLPRPVVGAARIAAFLVSAWRRGGPVEGRECDLNGQPALVAIRDGCTAGALMVSVVDGKIRRVFLHADPARLGHVSGWASDASTEAARGEGLG